jgi:hypothetical protein
VGYYGESMVLWSIYDAAVKENPETQEPMGVHPKGLEDLPVYVEGSLCVYWDRECRYPWQTEAKLNDARNDPVLRLYPEEFRRLWENSWTTGLDSFLEMGMIDLIMEEAEGLGLVNEFP